MGGYASFGVEPYRFKDGLRKVMRRKPGTVRIIAGKWRGRRLPVPDLPGLRPSGDRARETLFNWLQPHLNGARCADLFAGTGALGIEAASRGAGRVVLVEKQPVAVRSLRANSESLGSARIEVVAGDGIEWLEEQAAGSLDIVFIDPPFGSGLAEAALELIGRKGCVAPDGLVYMESPRAAAPVAPGPGWELAKDKEIGEVRLQLWKNSGPL